MTQRNIRLADLQSEGLSLKQQLAEAGASADRCRVAEAALRENLNETRQRMEQELSKLQQALQNEKDVSRRLGETAQKHRIAEEALQADIEQWVNFLVDHAAY